MATDESQVLRDQYSVCQDRGHDPEPGGYADNYYSWKVCKWCGTHYREETSMRIIERETPK